MSSNQGWALAHQTTQNGILARSGLLDSCLVARSLRTSIVARDKGVVPLLFVSRRFGARFRVSEQRQWSRCGLIDGQVHFDCVSYRTSWPRTVPHILCCDCSGADVDWLMGRLARWQCSWVKSPSS